MVTAVFVASLIAAFSVGVLVATLYWERKARQAFHEGGTRGYAQGHDEGYEAGIAFALKLAALRRRQG